MSEGLQVLLALPVVFVAAAVMGRWAQRKAWKLDRPYAERVAACLK